MHCCPGLQHESLPCMLCRSCCQQPTWYHGHKQSKTDASPRVCLPGKPSKLQNLLSRQPFQLSNSHTGYQQPRWYQESSRNKTDATSHTFLQDKPNMLKNLLSRQPFQLGNSHTGYHSAKQRFLARMRGKYLPQSTCNLDGKDDTVHHSPRPARMENFVATSNH